MKIRPLMQIFAFCLVGFFCGCSFGETESCYGFRDDGVFLHYYGGYPRGSHHYIQVSGAHPARFRYLENSRQGDCQTGHTYGFDGGTVFYRSFQIKGADASSFRVLGNGYSVDRNQVYFMANHLKDADRSSFVAVANKPGYAWGGDRLGVFYRNQRVGTGPEAKTLQMLHPPFFKDAHSVYMHHLRKEFIKVVLDPGTLVCPDWQKVPLYRFYIRDSRRAFYYERPNINEETLLPVSGIDPGSFEAINTDYARDRHRVYFKTKPVEGADPKTFHIPIKARTNRGKDRHHNWEDGRRAIQTR